MLLLCTFFSIIVIGMTMQPNRFPLIFCAHSILAHGFIYIRFAGPTYVKAIAAFQWKLPAGNQGMIIYSCVAVTRECRSARTLMTVRTKSGDRGRVRHRARHMLSTAMLSLAYTHPALPVPSHAKGLGEQSTTWLTSSEECHCQQLSHLQGTAEPRRAWPALP